MKHGHTFEGRPASIVVKLKSKRSIVFPLPDKPYNRYGYRVDCSTRADAWAALDPGTLPNKPVSNISDYNCAGGHSHEALPRKTAEQQGIVLEGTLLECKGCSMAKGLRREVSRSSHTLREIRSSGRCLCI